MNNTEQIVLDILKKVLNNDSISVINTTDSWEDVYEELRIQSLLPLTYSWVKRHDLHDSELKAKWTQKFASQSYRWYSMMEEQNELCSLLTEHGYAFAIIKGSANGIYYPVPEMRVSSDIDFLVRWDEYDEIYDFLLKNGYCLVGEKKESKHHVELKKKRVIFEMHKRPGGTRISGKYANQEMIDFFQKGLDHVELAECGKYSIPVLPRLQNAMVLLLHTAQHLREGLGPRHILDWMMFAKANVDDDFWYSELEDIARKGNVASLAKIMTKMCQKYLGLTDEITWCNDADESACDQLMEYVFRQGDFGIKAGKEDAQIRVLAESQSVEGFWRRTCNSSLYSMPAARKHVILRPIAVAYQLLRYLKKGMSQEHPFMTFNQSKEAGKNRADLFEKLGIKLD